MRSKINVLTVIAVFVAMLLQVPAFATPYETVAGDPLKTRIYTLDNGLTVYMSVNDETPRIQTFIAVKVGAKNDPSETTGLAHYFEHLMFKGTPNFGTQDYAAEKPLLDEIEQLFETYRGLTDESEREAVYARIDSISYLASQIAIPNEYDKLMSAIGSTGTNAYTGFDQTVYIENIPSNQIVNWAKIQADRFKNPILRGFHTELETIYEEKNMSLTNDGRKMFEKMMEALYPSHPYGQQTVLGSQEHLKNPSLTNIKKYHADWYVPNNMAIIVVGDFNPDEMIGVIEEYFGDMVPNSNIPTLEVTSETPFTAPRSITVMGNDAERIMLGWRAGGAASADADVLSILSDVLNNGKAGLIDVNLNQQQKVLGAGGGYNDFADHGLVILQGVPKAGQTLDEVKDLLLGEVAKLRNGDFDESLLQATINNYRATIMSTIESNRGRADWYVNTFLNGLDWSDEVNKLDRLGKITKAQVMEVANRLLLDNNYVAIYKRQGRDPDESKMPKPAITPIAMNRDVASDFLLEIQNSTVEPIEPVFVDYDRDLTKLKTSHGSEFLYVKNVTNDLFSLNYRYDFGTNNDPVLDMAIDYLEYLGTSKMSREEINREFYNIACSFSVRAGAERSSISIGGLSENMDKATRLLEDLLADPQPDEEVLAMLKEDIFKSREDAKSNYNANFSLLRTYANYGPKSPSTNVMTEEQIKAITSAELISRIKSLRNYQHLVTYYGPMDSGEAVAHVDRSLGNRKLKAVPAAVKYPYLETNENKVYVVHYDAPQISYAQYSNRGEKYDVTNAPYVNLYNTYFGSGMSSIVFQEMREARGLAYSSQATLNSPSRLENPYTFNAYIATQNDKMVDAIEAFEEIINNMPVSVAAFDIAKEALISNMRTSRTIKGSIISSYLTYRDLGIDYNPQPKNYETIQKLTLDDVIDFQKKWVKDRKYTFVVLGDTNDLDMDALAGYGPVTILGQEEIFGY